MLINPIILFAFLLIHPLVVSSGLPKVINKSTELGLTDEFVKALSVDEDGYIWVGTTNGVFKFDGYEYKKIKSNIQNLIIKDLFIDSNKNVWLATQINGLFKIKQEKWHSIKDPETGSLFSVNTIMEDDSNKIWLGTSTGAYSVNADDNEITKLNRFNQKDSISKIIKYGEKLVFAKKGTISIYNHLKQSLMNYPLNKKSNAYINDMLIVDDFIWVATNQGLLKFNLIDKLFIEVIKSDDPITFTTLAKNNQYIYAGSLFNGLYKIHQSNNLSVNFLQKDSINNSIIDNSIKSLLIKDNTLFIGNYHKGVSLLNLESLQFNFQDNSENSIHCAKSNVFYSGYLDSNRNLWLGSSQGLLRYNQNESHCLEIKPTKNLEETILKTTNIIEYNEKIWVATWDGLIQINKDTSLIENYFGKGVAFKKIFINPINQQLLFFDAGAGVYKIDKDYNFILVETKHLETQGLQYFDVKTNNKMNLLFATNRGLLLLDENNIIRPFSYKTDSPFNLEISTFEIINGNYLLVTKNKGLLLVSQNGDLIQQFSENEGVPKGTIIKNVITSKISNNVWMSSNNGIFRMIENKIHHFKSSDGINNNYFYDNFAFLGIDQHVYFGGQNGFIHFQFDSIKLNMIPPKIVFNELSLLNEAVKTNKVYESGFVINQPINDLDKIELSYKDYIIGIEFAALDFSDSMRNQYAYRLKGFKNDWVYTDAKDRQATYTNLSPGDYIFQVKASNKDGIWSKQPKELKILVNPAPWFSIWAYTFYVLFISISVWVLIRYNTIASRKRAVKLERTVKLRTQELNQKNKMVESLLEHKNEVFANVTHEFKTPLALILGPTELLVKQKELSQHSSELNMIQRNAKRLMLMVSQILVLSQAESDKEVIRESQSVQSILLMLFESFTPLVNDKDISLFLTNENDVNVYATSECLEVVVGNLLSNAVKYTNNGGSISITSTVEKDQVSISVQDSGSGIQKNDIEKIFKRFTRLDTHKNIAGTGIGLSVAKEITECNNGIIKVESEWGNGSIFSVTFPITNIKADKEMSQVMVDQLVQNTSNEFLNENKKPQTQKQKNRITVLIIEDNLDMQAHIGNVLNHRFNCLFADRGRKGIAIALTELPDIVICDIMMPGMDGYQVTRILRHDGRTSHMPIILLTALNNTKSRIKGWQENIDSYMTKPFSAEELNVQVDNIITIRKLLQKETNIAILNKSPIDTLKLSEQDKKFIEKFKDVIGKYYGNEYFQKADLASKMAISERQLHRKLIALINQSPMNMLRDYRLEQSAIKLKNGRQVSIVSDECGFSSVSYFGSCFKNKYGVTPKKYQDLDKE